jgi:hypothetical protein
MNTRSAAKANSSSEASLALAGKFEPSDSVPTNSAERSLTAIMTLARSAAGHRRISSMTSATLMISEIAAGKPQRQRPHRLCQGSHAGLFGPARAATSRQGTSPLGPHHPWRFLRKRPTSVPPVPRQGRSPFHPSPAGGRHNRRPAQPLPRTPTSQPTNSMLWHFLCRCEGPRRGGDARSRPANCFVGERFARDRANN